MNQPADDQDGDTVPLVLAGASGFGRETAAAVGAMNAAGARWHLLGFVDDNPDLAGGTVGGLPVLGSFDALDRWPDAMVVLCPASPAVSRRRIAERLGLADRSYATLVHPTASLGQSTVVGPGSVLLAGVITTTEVSIGAHVAVMPQATFTHDDLVADYATVGSGVRLSGGVRIGEGAYIGAGALVREGLSIGAGSLVGMGSVVTRDVPAGETWYGVPARPAGHLVPLAAKP